MASIQERLQLKRVPLDTWNVREQLCLASAVVRSGDQNWMSVSRALKTVGEPNRPPDWYSQKSCAAQYGVLLENVETPKRKKRSSEGGVETPQESILKKLTQERINEIHKTLADMNQQYEQLKNEVTESRNAATTEDRLREMWNDIETAKRARERENAKRAAWLKEREERRARVERTWRPPVSVTSTTTIVPAAVAPAPPASPLLTSLLKSSPVVTTPQHISHPANVVETISPSAGAPTLSMLLEKPGGTSPREKHAAIEHIKSQLVQIERQLKANTSGNTPAVDIDDIEIKAEDVYAFRDIDLHIPPVMPKPARIVDKPEAKKDEAEPTADNIPVETVEIKEENMQVDNEVDNEVETVDEVETTPKTPPAEPAIEKEEEIVPEVKIAFPEVKFPTAEIKVIQPDEEKTKEDKEPETTAEVEKEPEVDVVSETVPEAEVVEKPPSPVPEPAPEPAEESLDPGSIPLPAEPVSNPEEAAVEEEIIATEEPEPPLPPEVEKEEEPETKPEEAVENEPPAEVVEKDAEDYKKQDDAEFSSQDSIPLNEMLKEEAEPAQTEVKQDRQTNRPETEEAHTETDDDTPMELSREEEKDGKKKRDYSRKKKSDSRTCSGSESAAEASAPESPSASDSERQHRLWKKSVMLVYSRLCAHKYASLFLRPITDEEAPGYSAVVRKPMDLSTIRRHIDNGLIRTTAEFQRAVLLMLSNAMMYNSSSHSVHSMAKQMFEEAQSQLGILLAAQAHAGLCDEPPRRKRRRTHEPRPARH